MRRERDEPVASLQQFARQTSWVWGYCRDQRECGMQRPLKVQTYIDKWGAHAPAGVIRARSRCSRCGRLGIDIRHPSRGGRDLSEPNFPEDWTVPERPTPYRQTDFAVPIEDQIDW